MTPCSLVASYRLVGEIYGLYLSGLKSPSIFDIELGGSGIFQNVRMLLEASWNAMAHGDAREGKWRGNWRMEWVASTLQTTSELRLSSIITTSAASSRLNWSPRRFKWTRPFRRKTKSGFCACAITFQLASTKQHGLTSQKTAFFMHIIRTSNLTCTYTYGDYGLNTKYIRYLII